ncbi:MAG: hypothetical protein J0H47_01995 [Gammaproteobacteria bacterium]|nr:hypothetical protein [Gammaproteobacteria bacterium]
MGPWYIQNMRAADAQNRSSNWDFQILAATGTKDKRTESVRVLLKYSMNSNSKGIEGVP